MTVHLKTAQHNTPEPQPADRRSPKRDRRHHAIKRPARNREQGEGQPSTSNSSPTFATSNSATQLDGYPIPRRPTRRRPRLVRFFSDFTIEKAFTLISLVGSIALIILCTLDLTTSWPWMRASPLFDWFYLAIGIALFCLTINVFLDQS
ncbi:hypothetical protein FHS27_001949 [Rhodopirellula rubra]|uniref:Uncharacterized protein n=1 Tax=Aporhodopirellula rubra TaxID=980271 RepID=A0A7W5DX47_9BACT|nr:hypothetical protein [Aporhodopirellula rubra]MBB3206141.1 hypothetical protein [Aporhodopirellula rubra]